MLPIVLVTDRWEPARKQFFGKADGCLFVILTSKIGTIINKTFHSEIWILGIKRLAFEPKWSLLVPCSIFQQRFMPLIPYPDARPSSLQAFVLRFLVAPRCFHPSLLQVLRDPPFPPQRGHFQRCLAPRKDQTCPPRGATCSRREPRRWPWHGFSVNPCLARVFLEGLCMRDFGWVHHKTRMYRRRLVGDFESENAPPQYFIYKSSEVEKKNILPGEIRE